jgi:LytR cell envelope-related transcriptional attenuator
MCEGSPRGGANLQSAMEHSLPSLRLDPPWRTRALVAAAVAVIELVVILGVVVAIMSEPISHRVADAAEAKVLAPAKPKRKQEAKKAKPAVPVPKLERGETSVMVLNGNGEQGAAAAEADRLRGLGYLIGTVGNAPRTDFTQTVVMYRPGYKPEAKRLAKDLGLPTFTPLDGLSQKDLLGAHLAIVVGE